MQTVETEATVARYRVLREQVGRAGLLDRRPGYYCAKIALSVSGLHAGVDRSRPGR